MKRISRVSLCCLGLTLSSLLLLWGRTAAFPPRGFFPRRAARQAEFEQAFRGVPTPEAAREDLRNLTKVPRVAGTPEDYSAACYVLKAFQEAGLEAEIVEYRVLLPMPVGVRVDLVEPFKRSGPTPEGAGTKEGKDRRVVLGFNAYSPSGDVTAPVVYANYGLPEDYHRLEQAGIDVAGKLVIVRYGKCFRGVKTYVAEEHHAAGLLIYSDPAEDGFRRGDVYPGGPWRPSTAIQRGSILYMTKYAGDPLTPGLPATKDAKRLALQDAVTLPHVPTVPLSSEDAAPILKNLGGQQVPPEWQGGLPFPYHFGPGPAKVHLTLKMDFAVRPIWNVVARIKGEFQPESWVILGNHRDAWTYGAVDPLSGTASLLAVARGLGRLEQQGWKPARTIVLASWDAEEFGIIGSTEWAEEHADELGRGAVAYLNTDVAVGGNHFAASSVPSLRGLLREVSQAVLDPKTEKPLYNVWLEESGKSRNAKDAAPVMPVLGGHSSAEGVNIGELGAGSDYVPFLQHLGVPSLDFGFGGPYGVYHSIYDNFFWMEHFGDPTFKYSVVAAQVFGTLALRLADADILPFDYEEYGRAFQGYLDGLEKETAGGKQVEGGLPLEPIRAAAVRFTDTARSLNEKIKEASERGTLAADKLATLNQALLRVERSFLLEPGLPGRAWFRHAFYAPGVYTGYAAVVMPGVREALERNDAQGAAEQLEEVRAAIERGTQALNQALAAVEEAPGAGGAP